MLPQKLKHLLGFIILLNLTVSAFSQKRNANEVDFEKELIQVQDGIWDNPACLAYRHNKSFTDVSLGAKQWKANEFHLIEKGNKMFSVDFDAYSFKKREKSFVFGRASYSKSNTSNIKWSTVSDYQELAPYIVADTIGGKSYSENYYFEGIYSLIHKRNNYAIQVKYRSAEDYRKLDPRPQSTVSNLEVILGGTREINSKYKIGLHAGFKDYQQNHYVDALRPGTGIKVFYLRGLGISDENFSSVITNGGGIGNIYEIKGYSLGVQLLPNNQSGVFQSISYKKSKLELLKLVGTQFDIVNDLDSRVFNFELGKQYVLPGKTFKIKGFASYQDQKGSDYNYNHNRKLLSLTEKYTSGTLKGGVDGILFVKKEKYNAFYQSRISYHIDESEYQLSSSQNPKKEIEKLSILLNAGRSFRFSKSSLNIKLSALADYNISSELTTSSLAADGANEALVIPNYEFLSADKLIFGSDIRYDIDTKKSYNIFTRVAYHQMIIRGSKSQYGFNLAIGLTL